MRDVSFDAGTRAQFQAWLKARYGTLDNLNDALDDRLLERDLLRLEPDSDSRPAAAIPGLLLSWMRFVSDTWRSYQKNQLDVIRANADPKQFITTNMMGWFDGYDHYTVEQDLDLAAWDDYVGRASRPQIERRGARPYARIQAQEFLGHGDAARAS